MKPDTDTIVDTSTDTHASPRLAVAKTYKLYLGGKFPRTESGRYYKLFSGGGDSGEVLANVCLGSRKDFRNAVVAARAAQPGWASASAFLKSQILYRVAEMLEGRASQFAAELVSMGLEPEAARAEVTTAIDRLVHFAGWADKYQQVFSAVNPVASSHFNFTILEPTGVVAVIAPEASPLAGLVSALVPVIVGGNTAVVIASHARPLSAITLAEVLHTSDVPGGVVNLITGDKAELLPHVGTHMDVNAVVYADDDRDQLAALREAAADNLKRVVQRGGVDWLGDDANDPYTILATQEVKTTWHPIGV